MIAAGQYHELTATWDLIVSFLNNAAADLKDGNHVYRYTAGHNMPGYLPDGEPACFLDFEDACDHIDDVASEHAELFEEEQNEYEDGSDQFNMAAENASAATAVGLFALEATEPFIANAAGRVYWIIDNGLVIDHDAI